MQRSASFCGRDAEKTRPPSRIPTPIRGPGGPGHIDSGVLHTPVASPTPESALRRSASLRLPSKSRTGDREVWGIGTGSWGKRQQMRRQQGIPEKPRSAASSPLTPVTPRGFGSNSYIDKLQHRSCTPYDDDDLCSERSYDSTMSVDRASCRSRRYVVHCGSGHAERLATNGNADYLTPTQRAVQLNRELKAQLRKAMDDLDSRDQEIARLTQECVELRMHQVCSRGSASPDPIRSFTPSYMEKDSLNSSVHSSCEPQVPIETATLALSDKGTYKVTTKSPSPFPGKAVVSNERPAVVLSSQADVPQSQPGVERVITRDISERPVIAGSEVKRPPVPTSFPLPLSLTDSGTYEDASLMSPPSALGPSSSPKPKTDKPQDVAVNASVLSQEASTQTDPPPPADPSALQEQLNAANQALVETKGAQQRRPEAMLSAEEAVSLWRHALWKVQLSRARAALQNSQTDVTLQFLKSAFFHLVTDSGQGAPTATKSHWKAIQSILGFSQDECRVMDEAMVAELAQTIV